jgi:hypothetical protein
MGEDFGRRNISEMLIIGSTGFLFGSSSNKSKGRNGSDGISSDVVDVCLHDFDRKICCRLNDSINQ